MEDYLMKIDIKKCVLCYACVRNCPVKAISVSSDSKLPIEILNDTCIACGACYEVCPYDAVKYLSHTDRTKEALSGKAQTIALIAPSVAGEFSDITDHRKFVQMLRQIGFNMVHEVAMGVDMVAKEYISLFENAEGKNYITANCPVVVSNIEMFQPELLDNLSPIVSPWIASVKMLRQEYGKEVKIIYIGPCIAAKDEAKRYKDELVIDAVLTFEELRGIFDEFGIEEKNLRFSEFDSPISHKGSLYPISNGLLQIMGESEDLIKSRVITCEGHKDFVNSLKNFNQDVTQIKKHLNIFYCVGCISGPGTRSKLSRFIKQSKVVKFTKKRQKSFDKERWQEAIDKYSKVDYSCSFKINDQRRPKPSQKEIDKTLRLIGKDNAFSERGCGACGYENCTEFSIAVAEGLAEPMMCFTHNLKNNRKTIHELSKANEIMEYTKNELESSKKQALSDKLKMEEAHKITNTMLQELPSAVIIVDKDLKILQSNKGLINILGEDALEISKVIPALIGADLKKFIDFSTQKLFTFVLNSGENIINRDIHLNGEIYTTSLFQIKDKEIVGAVFRNLKAPEIQKEQVIERVTEVIDKNLEMVQKIGFLLGEGAAETEQMLNSILESYKKDNSNSKNTKDNPFNINLLNK